MKLIKPSVEYISQEGGLDGIYRQIERCARTCYKSEDRITEDSAKKMVDGLIKSGHGAMLEHGTVYLYLEVTPFNAFSHFEYPLAKFTAPYNWSDVVGSIAAKYRSNPYSEVISSNDSRNYRKVHITTNFRVLVENGWLDDLQFTCDSPRCHKKRYTIKFICDRGVSHELVRHRRMSFAQESQRYCNYSKDKFGGVSFIEPSWFNSKDSSSEQREAFIQICQDSEECYLKLLDNWDNKKPDRRFKTGFKGNPLTPQQARCVLPNATKTEIILTGFEDDWKHFFDLRLRGTTGKPHPDMLILAEMAHNTLKENVGLEL